jgi:ABC-2 type transport system permease protein
MKKFFAVVKREYLQRVRSKMFVVMTILGPLMLAVFTIVPGLLFTIKTGGDTRIAIVDLTEGRKLSARVRDALVRHDTEYTAVDTESVASSMNSNAKSRLERAGKALRGSFSVEEIDPAGRPLAELRKELNARIGRDELDAYLVIPADVLENGASNPSYHGRNVGDVITRGQIEDRLNRAITRQRLVENGVKEQYIEQLSQPVELTSYGVNDKGEEGVKDTGSAFILAFVIAFLIYITVLLYGQVILGAIVEEKETRIAEILFSSVQSFTLMMGKLFGVSLLALTQLGIWTLAFLGLSLYGIDYLASKGFDDIAIPHLPLSFFVYFFLFFVVGYFIYTAIYVLIGSMVTTAQEGGQLAMPVVFVLMAGLYMGFPVIRSPNSSFAFWVSMVPFFSPITMIVRIVSQTPPTWQIVLSLLIGGGTAVLMLWVSSRIYRIGMLMYGKKASIPEVLRWVRQP